MCASVHKALRRLSSIIKSKAISLTAFVNLVGPIWKMLRLRRCTLDFGAMPRYDISIKLLQPAWVIIYLMSNCEFFGKGFQYASHVPPSMRVPRVGPTPQAMHTDAR
ncbi:hypothetical protein OKW41_002294 [Paraburkholderia sp. UCT70]